MKDFSGRLLLSSLLVIAGHYCIAQGGFKKIVNAAYDSSLQGSYTAAIDLLYRAAALKGKDTTYNASINLYFGNNYEALNKVDSSIYYYGEALKYFESKKDYASLAFIYNRLGSAEINFTRRYQKAISYFNKQIQYTVLVNDSSYLFDAWNNIGIAYKLLNHYDSALSCFRKVMNNTSVHNHSGNRAALFIADTYSVWTKPNEALFYYDRAITNLIPAQDSAYLFIAYLNKGDCLMKQKRFGESMTCLLNAQQFLNATVIDSDRKELYHNLAEVLQETGNFKKAFYYKNLESDLKDSINTANIQRAAAEAEAKYEVRRNQDSLLISKQQLSLSVNQSRINQRNFVIMLIAALAISLLAFFAFRNARIRKRTNQKLETLASELDEANQTKTKLFSIISHDLRSPISSLYALLKLQELKAADLSGNIGISEQATHLLDTMEDLLIWSKSQMDKFTLQPVKVQVGPLYEELIKLYRDVADSRNITIVNQTSEDITIITDENLLKTLLRNTLSNAISHSSAGSSIQLDVRGANRGILCIISNEAAESNFQQLKDKLQQASLDSGNHGLGLFLLKEFMDKLQATIDLSYIDGLIHFKLYIPQLK